MTPAVTQARTARPAAQTAAAVKACTHRHPALQSRPAATCGNTQQLLPEHLHTSNPFISRVQHGTTMSFAGALCMPSCHHALCHPCIVHALCALCCSCGMTWPATPPAHTINKDLGIVSLGSLLNTMDVPIVAKSIGSITQFQT